MYRFLYEIFSGNKPPTPSKEIISGKVTKTHYAKNSKGQPTFLDISNHQYKYNVSVIIWGKDRKNFKIPPEMYYLNKKVQVSEKTNYHKNKITVSIKNPKQIKMNE